jgi:coproporphyrinogen III oxidase
MGKQLSLAPLRILYDHLKDSRTKWVKWSKKQQDKIIEEFKEMVQEGKLEEKIWNGRSDKGGMHQICNPKRRIYRPGGLRPRAG